MERPGSDVLALHPVWGLHAMGVCGILLATAHVIVNANAAGLLEGILVGGIAATLVYSGYDVQRRDLSDANQWWVVKYTALGVVTYTLLAAAVMVVFTFEGEPIPKTWFLLTLAGVLGGATTVQAGLYAAESRAELTRAEELTKLLKISQRVLRHNLRNELAIALGHLDNIEHDYGANQDTARLRKHLNALVETGDEARQLVTIWEQDQRTEFDLCTVVENAVAAVKETYPQADVSTDVPASCPVTAHLMLPEAVEEALSNAVEHTSTDTDIEVDVSDGTDRVDLRVADTGPGVPDLERRAILEGEDALAHSRGLGLWLIYWVIEKSGGDLHITDNDPSGTVVHFRLPRATGD